MREAVRGDYAKLRQMATQGVDRPRALPDE